MKTCESPDYQNKVRAKGLCGRHLAIASGKECAVEFCTKPVRAKNLCSAHYARIKRWGSIEPDRAINAHKWTQHDAERVAEAAQIELLEPFKRVDVPITFRCKNCGKTSQQSINVIRRAKVFACYTCSHSAGGAKRRSKLAGQAVEVMRRAQAEPLEDYPGAGRRWKCRCLRCHQVIFPRLANVKTNLTGNACNSCRYLDAAQKLKLTDDEIQTRAELLGFEMLERFPFN